MAVINLRHTAATAVTALLVTGLAACGGNSDNAAGGDTTTSAAASDTTSATTDTSAATDTSSDAASAPDVADGSAISGSQLADIIKAGYEGLTTAHGKMTMSISTGGKATDVAADIDLQMKPSVAESMTMTMQGMQIQAILIDGKMYMKSPAMNAVSKGKWLELSTDSLGSVGSGLSSAMTNPVEMFNQLSKYIEKGKYVGEESVDGANAKHYTITIDTSGALKSMGLSSAAAGSVPKSVDENIWIDDQGRPVKMTMDMGSTESVSMTLSDFGKSLHIAAPPASQVTKMPTGSLG